MRATIVHESRGRMRLRLRQKTMTFRQADLLETWLKAQSWTKEAVVHERTCCVIVTYAGERETVLSAIGGFTWTKAEESVTPSQSQYPGTEPGISGETGGQGADEGGRRPVPARSAAGCPGNLAYDALSP